MSGGDHARDGDFELVTLRNGHRAVRHVVSGEVMHPSVGPWAEANRLYVEQLGLEGLLRQPGEAPVRIFDVGLGAATNATAALECARRLGDARQRPLEVISFERDMGPLRLVLADPAGFPHQAQWAEAGQTLLTRGAWEAGGLSWRLSQGEFLERLGQERSAPDLVFFDPFSPRVNPELWSVAALKALHARCAGAPSGTQLATYSAATPTRLSFLLAGFFVGVGASVGSKGETTVAATRAELLREPLGEPFLARWRRSTARAPHGELFDEELERRVLRHPQFQSSVPHVQP